MDCDGDVVGVCVDSDLDFADLTEPMRHGVGHQVPDRADQVSLGHVHDDPGDGTTSRVRSYVPDPQPSDLVETGSIYPAQIQNDIRIGNTIIPPWGSGGTIPAPRGLARSYIARYLTRARSLSGKCRTE